MTYSELLARITLYGFLSEFSPGVSRYVYGRVVGAERKGERQTALTGQNNARFAALVMGDDPGDFMRKGYLLKWEPDPTSPRPRSDDRSGPTSAP